MPPDVALEHVHTLQASGNPNVRLSASETPAANFPFPGAAWVSQGAFAFVTWTGKLAECVSNLIGMDTSSAGDTAEATRSPIGVVLGLPCPVEPVHSVEVELGFDSNGFAF
jgi:hypothetical protein